VTGKAAGAEAIMTLQGPFFFFQRKLIADLALKHQLPLAMSEALAGDAGALAASFSGNNSSASPLEDSLADLRSTMPAPRNSSPYVKRQ
jgi:hypothetical protein